MFGSEPSTATWTRLRSALVYLAIVIPALIVLNAIFIPLHAPDDEDHLKRAYLLSRGVILPANSQGMNSGGPIDTALLHYIHFQEKPVTNWPLQGPLLAPLGLSTVERQSIQWSGEEVYSPFAAGAISYLPLIYLPQAAGLWIGETLGLTVERSIQLARLTNGITAGAISALCLLLFDLSAALTLFVLILPKTLVHFASNSTDPMICALTIVTVGFICRASLAGVATRKPTRFAQIAICLAIVGGVRPPSLALALPAVWVAMQRRSWTGVGLILAGVLTAVAWTVIVVPKTVSDACNNGGTPIGQKLQGFIDMGPWFVPRTIAYRGLYYAESFVGEIGWGHGPTGSTDLLPLWVYGAAPLLLGCALVSDGRPETVSPHRCVGCSALRRWQ